MFENFTTDLSEHSFEFVRSSFFQGSGLAFMDVLPEDMIRRVFGEWGALFAMDTVYNTPRVLWGFLGQVLRDGKDSSCASAVANITTYLHQQGQPVPCGDTGDYCRAQAKLDIDALASLVSITANRMEQQARPEWLFHGLHATLIDGFTFKAADTPANQKQFPQTRSQKPGVGFPIIRAVGILSLATAAIEAVNIGSYSGKTTGETALLRGLLDHFGPGDVTVLDRHYGSYMSIAMLAATGAEVCTRLHQRRDPDGASVVELGPNDTLIMWNRPSCPTWMTQREYKKIPDSMTLRQVDLQVHTSDGKLERLSVITTLTDAEAYPAEAIAELYGYRWNVELDIRSIKSTLGLDFVTCKSPAMIQRHLLVTLLGYNLIRSVNAQAASEHDKQPRQLGFTAGCNAILSNWMLQATGVTRDPASLLKEILRQIARKPVANRPGRIEPRVVKRRPKPHKLMTKSRKQLRKKLATHS